MPLEEQKKKEKEGEKKKEQETEPKQFSRDLNVLKPNRISDVKDNLMTSKERVLFSLHLQNILKYERLNQDFHFKLTLFCLIGSENDGEEDRKKTSSLFTQKEDDFYWGRGHVQEKVARWNQDSLANQQSAEETRRKKEKLLAKMREIDLQNQGAQDAIFAELSPAEPKKSEFSSPRPPEQRNRNSSVFNHNESEDTVNMHAGIREGGRRRGVESGAVTAGIGRRALRSQTSSDKLAFGGYAPSFGHSASQVPSGVPQPLPKEDRDLGLEDAGLFDLGGTEKRVDRDKKANLLQQLFGPQAVLAAETASTVNKMEVLNNSSAPNGVRSRRDTLLSFSSGSSTPPVSSVNTLHVAESRPAIRAIKSFDDEIEEFAL